MKVKVFCCYPHDLEDLINRWLQSGQFDRIYWEDAKLTVPARNSESRSTVVYLIPYLKVSRNA
jgi:hypothetical protein